MSKDKRYKPVEDPRFVEDDRWKRKGVPHLKKNGEPEICHCQGLDLACPDCEGEGVIFE